MGLVVEKSYHRKAHHKVKTGCTACKVRRQKCNEQRPTCNGCIRHSTRCLYLTPENKDRRPTPEPRCILPLVHVSTNEPSQLRVPDILPPLPPSRDLNLVDLELLHQYMTSTSIAKAQLPGATTQIQTTVPQLAQMYPFVMRGILAQAAIHLSWLRPDQQAHYTLLAANHHAAALPEFRCTLQELSKQNFRALIAYAKGLLWCSFAGFGTFPPYEQVNSPGTVANWLPQWFNLLRGSCQIVERCKPWIEEGSYFLPPPLDDLSEFSNSADSQRLSALKCALVPLVESSLCEPVLSALQGAFARASMRQHNTPLRNAANFWLGTISDEYLDEVRKQEPWALVVMTFFCVLVHRSEAQWFMRGHASDLLLSILDRLPTQWKPYTSWPCEEIGV